MIWLRLIFFPVLFGLLAWFVFSDPAVWRRTVAVIAGSVLSAFFVVEVFRFRRQGLGRFGIELNLTVAAVGHLTMVSATGGIESPFVYAMMPIGFVIGLFVSSPTVIFLAGHRTVTFLPNILAEVAVYLIHK